MPAEKMIRDRIMVGDTIRLRNGGFTAKIDTHKQDSQLVSLARRDVEILSRGDSGDESNTAMRRIAERIIFPVTVKDVVYIPSSGSLSDQLPWRVLNLERSSAIFDQTYDTESWARSGGRPMPDAPRSFHLTKSYSLERVGFLHKKAIFGMDLKVEADVESTVPPLAWTLVLRNPKRAEMAQTTSGGFTEIDCRTDDFSLRIMNNMDRTHVVGHKNGAMTIAIVSDGAAVYQHAGAAYEGIRKPAYNYSRNLEITVMVKV